jgi:competence protein ComEA
VGQVRTPGLVELPAGSRVGDALHAAGGATDAADLSVVNLARVLVDGEQVVVPAPGEVSAATARPGTAPGAPGTASEAAVVDLNTAGLAELDALPGIGPVLAQRILDWRTDNGAFRDVAELGEVAGIGETLLGRLRPMVTV